MSPTAAGHGLTAAGHGFAVASHRVLSARS
jgi:hypothetical protein